MAAELIELRKAPEPGWVDVLTYVSDDLRVVELCGHGLSADLLRKMADEAEDEAERHCREGRRALARATALRELAAQVDGELLP